MAWHRCLKRALLSKSYRKCLKYLKKSHRTSDLWWGVLCGSFCWRRYISRDQDSGFGEMADYIGLLVPPERVSLTYLITWKWPCLPSSYNLPSKSTGTKSKILFSCKCKTTCFHISIHQSGSYSLAILCLIWCNDANGASRLSDGIACVNDMIRLISRQDANDWHGNQGSRVHIP